MNANVTKMIADIEATTTLHGLLVDAARDVQGNWLSPAGMGNLVRGLLALDDVRSFKIFDIDPGVDTQAELTAAAAETGDGVVLDFDARVALVQRVLGAVFHSSDVLVCV